jgi:single-strand DNA-binding protein
MSNIFTCVGTITRDAEVRFSSSGMAILNVSIANNQGFGDKQKTIFVRCSLLGKRAEGSLKEYLLKGQQILVSGELTQSEYKANDGTTKTSLELNANIIDLIGKKDVSAPQRPAPARQVAADDFNDDIPF